MGDMAGMMHGVLLLVLLEGVMGSGVPSGSILNADGWELFKSLIVDDVVHEGTPKPKDEGWRIGRGTFYGNEYWAWSIHEGSCGYGYIWEDEPMGWDVAAIPDVHYEFAGSCGTCYEVACAGINFRDNYNNHLDRTHVCYNTQQTVVVRITDTCPCNYVTNAYSNRRWCCGDMDHFDLSVWAFEKLADLKWGVIGLKYRPVSCDYEPPNPAPKPSNSFPPEFSRKPATRPYWLPVKGQPKTEDGYQRPAPPGSEPKDIYVGGIKGPFWEKTWNSQRVSGWTGPSGGEAFCGNVHGYGAIGVSSEGGQFDNHVSMEMWLRTQDGVPDLRLQLRGSNGECGMVLTKDLRAAEQRDGYSRYTIYLGLFDFGAHHARVTAFASEFKGCGKNSAADIRDLYIRNDQGRQQFVCVDKITLI